MKNVFKLGLVAFGFALATFATSNAVSASTSSATFNEPASGGCYGSGNCGITDQGTVLYGKWREAVE